MAEKKKEEEEATGGRGTTIERCTCKNAWQDKRYGPKMRVHNIGARAGARTKRSCTVCAKDKT